MLAHVAPVQIRALLGMGRASEAVAVAVQVLDAFPMLGGFGVAEVEFRLAASESFHASGDVERARAELQETLRQVQLRADDITDSFWKNSYLTRNPYCVRANQLAKEWGLDIVVRSKPGVWQRKEGGYFVHARPTNPRTGRKVEIQRVLHRTETALAAYAQLQQLIRDVKAGPAEQPRQRFRFCDWAQQLFERRVRTAVLGSAFTRNSWRSILKCHLLPVLGDFYMDQLRRADVIRWREELAEQVTLGAIKPGTANKRLKTLKTILSAWVRDHESAYDPARGVELLDTTSYRTYTRALGRAFASAAQAVGLGKHFTPHGMRRTNKDLLRRAGISQVVSMALSGHLTERMHEHYSTVGGEEMRQSIAKVVQVAGLQVPLAGTSGVESGVLRKSGRTSERHQQRQKHVDLAERTVSSRDGAPV